MNGKYTSACLHMNTVTNELMKAVVTGENTHPLSYSANYY